MKASVMEQKSTNVRALLRRRRRALARGVTLHAARWTVAAMARVSPEVAVDAAAFLFFKPQRTRVHEAEARVFAAGNKA